jgi:hypothetical protein
MVADKFKSFVPDFFGEIGPGIKHSVIHFLHKLKSYLPVIKNYIQEEIKFLKQVLLSGKGYLTEFLIYLHSDEFKKNRFSLFTKIYKICIENPIVISLRVSAVLIFSISTFLIFTNTKKVITGTGMARGPASVKSLEHSSENIVELKNHMFEVEVKTAGGGHGAATAPHELEVIFDIRIETSNKELLEEMEEKLDVELEAFDFAISGLPISPEEQKANEIALTTYLNKEFFHLSEENIFKSITLKQSPKGRPSYFDQEDRTFAMKDVGLQIFLEDTSYNKQVTLDYSLLASNRNVVLYFKDHENKIRDRFSTQIEPIIPQFPIEEEGRRIIKDKIRSELNELLKEEQVEGRVLEIYIDYILGS